MQEQIPLEWTREYKLFIQCVPDVSVEQARLIKKFWPVFWNNPKYFENTDLKEIIIAWCNK